MSVTWSRFRRQALNVWRETTVADGAGGFTVSYVDQGSELVKVVQSTPTERMAAQQWGGEHTHNLYADPAVDVRRTDRLAPSGTDPNTTLGYYRILGTATDDAGSYDYAKWIAERVEAGP